MGIDITAILALILIFGFLPLLGIGVAGFNQWLKFKERQREMGASTHELEKEMETLRQDRQNLVRRIETLEAIVTSEDWDERSGGALGEGEPLLDDRAHQDDAPPSDAGRATRTGRRPTT